MVPMRNFSALALAAAPLAWATAALACADADSEGECSHEDTLAEEYASLLQTNIKLDSSLSRATRTRGDGKCAPFIQMGNDLVGVAGDGFRYDGMLSNSSKTMDHESGGKTFRSQFGEGLDRSQYWQASILHKTYFANAPPIQPGVVVEVGAANGLGGSNSYAFEYGLGWRTVLIEANVDSAAALKINRPRAEVHAPLAVSSTRGHVDFTICPKADTSGIGVEFCDDVFKFSGLEGARIVKVPSEPLSSILEDSRLNVVDILFVDVEGAELEVLKTIDFAKTKIRVINVETGCPSSEVGDLLESQCYVYRGNIGADSVWTLCGFQP